MNQHKKNATRYTVTVRLEETFAAIFENTIDKLLEEKTKKLDVTLNNPNHSKDFYSIIRENCLLQLDNKLKGVTGHNSNTITNQTIKINIYTPLDHTPPRHSRPSRTPQPPISFTEFTKIYGEDMWVTRTGRGFELSLHRTGDRDFHLKNLPTYLVEQAHKWLDTAVTFAVISVADYYLDHKNS